MPSSSPHRTRPLVALRALAALSADPDDLPKVFTIIDSLPGRAPARMLARMRGSEEGRRLLASKPDLALRLADRAALRALPQGTLGRAYAALMDREGITPQGIVDASDLGRERSPELSEEQRFIGNRMRDSHDLWHAVTGYGPDLLGEASLLCFTYAQTKNPGVALVAFLGLMKADSAERRMMWEGYRRGQRAEWLPAIVWEELLDRPLEEVRERMRVGPPPVYAPVTTAALRESGVLSPRAAS